MATTRIPGPVNVGSPDELDQFDLPGPGTQRGWLRTRPRLMVHHTGGSPDWRHRHEPGWSLAARSEIGCLLVLGGSPEKGVSDEDFEQAAKDLGVEVKAIKAVSEVETKRRAFDDLGRPSILFERHYFHRLTGGEFTDSHPVISQPTPTPQGGYGPYSKQYAKLQEAYALDKEAALSSASWGRFQIMGANFRGAGFSSVLSYVKAIAASELAHLRAFVALVRASAAMHEALRKKNWARFAYHYNGSGYQRFHYDEAMRKAYEALSRAKAAE